MLLRWEDSTRKVARIGWSKRDASVYVMLYATDHQHRYAGTFALSGLTPLPLDLRQMAKVNSTTGVVKLSMHESGHCHAELDGRQTRTVRSTPLTSGFDGHLCTILVSDPASLPVLAETGPTRTTDLTADSRDFPWNGAQFFLFAFQDDQDTGGEDFPMGFALRRGDNRQPLWIGLWPHAFQGEQPADPGVLAFAGFRRERKFERMSDRVFGLVTSEQPVAEGSINAAMASARAWSGKGPLGEADQ